MNLRNQALAEGHLLITDAIRRTPAGIAMIEGWIIHQSEQTEAGLQRKVDCEIPFVALGDICQKLITTTANQKVKCKGFLAARSSKYRQSLVLHITAFEYLN
ncbi:primosomal replication protein N [Chitinibacter bivalviorum]|uniref:Primosomal replication protein N n=1 Tax=Chitinibacter bivalviorum TaxID=2739434 RepID=A0A7H9BJI6_9NEIS|nr:primosomal replication protein N [Chitinibacter bivalviorum]QLG87724.1 primosomal replication protein N [Chitinibacter bivalviorum]